ncbi:MAG: LD-carboxypeptidase [Prolixibacteraceae bacterium]|jgi:muramoyltetrapeptide carboxypeptidase|nr:LD-carboxypeptidase [Prolixibacteraceae bacterium]
MIIPPYLKPGDKIGILSTASKIDKNVVFPAVELLKTLGYQVVLGKSIFSQYHQFAGTDSERRIDLQKMLDDESIKTIICSRGGYGSIRTIENIDWSMFQNSPKWIVGFSDVTTLHSQLNQLRISSIHGVMPRYFVNNNIQTKSFDTLLKALNGESLEYSIQPSKFNKEGSATGELIGGNLSILYSLRGTPMDINTNDKILFIEDLSEYLYHLDRIMMNLKHGNKLKKLKGLIVGSFSGMKDNDTPYGKSIEEIILEAVSEYNFPVLFNFPAGHQTDNCALKMGCNVTLSIDRKTVTVSQ